MIGYLYDIFMQKLVGKRTMARLESTCKGMAGHAFDPEFLDEVNRPLQWGGQTAPNCPAKESETPGQGFVDWDDFGNPSQGGPEARNEPLAGQIFFFCKLDWKLYPRAFPHTDMWGDTWLCPGCGYTLGVNVCGPVEVFPIDMETAEARGLLE